MDLARLQAGHELRDVKPFDAAIMLSELSENLQPMAAARGLFLKAHRPGSRCRSMAMPLRSTARSQNLLLNALKYTRSGGVTVGWGTAKIDDPKRWVLSVQDTGPGIHAGPGAPLAEALEEATTESQEVDEREANENQKPAPAPNRFR